MHKIQVPFSSKGINRAIKELQEYRNSLPTKLQLFTETLAQEGVTFAQSRIITYGANLDGLLDSIKAEPISITSDECIILVVADNDQAAFIEFGTGQIGKEAPYPYPLPSSVTWEYMIGKHIFELKDEKGQFGWIYKKNGTWHFTQGMASRPFMYETGLELESIVVEKAKEIFGA